MKGTEELFHLLVPLSRKVAHMSCLPMAASTFSSYFAHLHPFSTPSIAPCHLQSTCRCCFSLAFPGLLLHQGECLMQRVGSAPRGALAKISPLSPLLYEWVQNKLSRNLHSGLHGLSTEFWWTDQTYQKFFLLFQSWEEGLSHLQSTLYMKRAAQS